MTKFEGTFQGRTTGGFGGVTMTAGGILALAGVLAAVTHPHQAAEAMSGAVAAAAIVTGVFLAAVVAFVIVKVRRRSAITVYDRPSSRPGLQWQANPNAIPVRERPAIAAPVQHITNFFGADATAAYLQSQAVPVYRATAEPAEQQEIQR